ncbi:branched-chain amino acid ABC transporter ATP-binding protein/permease [Bradyrhizobium sp. Pear77]|uniref:branched-chain amino acid ABC transporter ATP-binding protein/permease n=1 Tax=Bradyrhizobium TaxID=374 RepID=UPI001E356CF9|nr:MULTISPECIES: branched-chain amino acid ABC transporter ATP-binding protein/permease [Bradyrhizobium]MCC8954366.1 branched-chain amino acid ABC transporter ATP-binding protein/permease [Bradyrhizobium altum]MCC8964374.1 branched-chain amino acid ABC transporter ATP-binding protein/permease [Bradyrhizobium oropedii]
MAEKSIPSSRRSPATASIVVAFAMFVLACIIAAIGPQYDVTLLVTVGLTSIAAMGLTLLLIAGQVSLGQAAFMAIGAYVSAILARDFGVPAFVALILGVAASALSGVIVGAITLRLKGHFLPLASLAIGIATSAAIVAAGGITGGASGLGQIPPLAIGPLSLTDDRGFAVVVWLLVAVLGGGLSRLLHTRAGRAIAALKTDAEMAEIFGVNAARLRLIVFVVAATLAGLSGTLYAYYFKFLSPAPFGLTASINLLIACIFGGMAHPFGAVLGAAAITALEMLLQNTVARMLGLSGNVELIVFGLVLICVLLRWPGGIWSALQRIWPQFSAARPGRNIELTPSKRSTAGEDLLTVTGISKNFGGLKALQGISFGVGPDQIVGLIGPNGAGKSTTFNIATGLLAPSEGDVLLMGEKPPRRVSDLVHRGVSRTFQHVRIIPERTVLENVAFGAYAQGHAGMMSGMFGFDRKEEAATYAKAWRALEIVELDGLAHEPASRLAMGQARLVEVARALVSRPRLLLLDEPAAGLRTGEKLKLVTLLHRLKRAGMSVLLVEHDMDLVMNCVDRVVVLDRGQGLMTGLPEEVRQDERVIAAYLGA